MSKFGKHDRTVVGVVAVLISIAAVFLGLYAGTDISITAGAALGVYVLVLWRSCLR